MRLIRATWSLSRNGSGGPGPEFHCGGSGGALGSGGMVLGVRYQGKSGGWSRSRWY